MRYATLMVNLEPGGENASVLQVAGQLAARFEARVIGVAASQPIALAYGDGYLAAETAAEDREQLEHGLDAAELEFRRALEGRVARLDWRAGRTVDPPAYYVAREACRADLLITAGAHAMRLLDPVPHMNPGDLIMQTGRPVLTVPTNGRTFDLGRVVVAWQDTREARRAIADAVPLLRVAQEVAVVEIAAERDLASARGHLEDLAGWLQDNGVEVRRSALVSSGDTASQLDGFAREHGADLLVAGAYGHSRVREWMLGGVTRHLLFQTERCCLFSH